MADRDEVSGDAERAISPGFVVGVILLLAVLDFILQNNDTITLHFLFFSREAHVWMVVLIASVLAVVATELLSRVIRRSRRRN